MIRQVAIQTVVRIVFGLSLLWLYLSVGMLLDMNATAPAVPNPAIFGHVVGSPQ